jgi:hypothetical protein
MNNFRRYFILLCLTLLGISYALVARGRVTFPGRPGPDFDTRIQLTHTQNISKLQPDMVVLGDSIVDENVDPASLSAQLGLKVYPMSYGGSASALWYLALKNNILPATHHPKYLVILFRDSILTAPGYRVQGKFASSLDDLAAPEDMAILERAYTTSMNPLEDLAERYLPPYGYRLQFRAITDEHIYLLPRFLLRCGKRCVDGSLIQVFNFKNAAPNRSNSSADLEEYMLYAAGALDFNARVQDSFLPEIIRLCNENHIQLVLVRAKTARFASPAMEPSGLDQYMTDLEAYLANNGVLFADISHDPRIRLDDFVDNFHVYPASREKYTDVLGDALRSILP